MRARLMAIVLSLFMGLGLLALTAGAASASTPTPDAGSLGAAAPWQPTVAPDIRAADDDSGEALHGRFQARIGPDGERVGVAGITVTVSKDGAEVDTATSDDEGNWKVELPGPGSYSVKVDPGSLPDTVQLRDPDRTELPAIDVDPGSNKIAIFALEPAGGGGGGNAASQTTRLEYYIGIFLAGLRYGLIIAMTAVGLSLIFGTTGLINFAHGELVTLGAVVVFIFGTSPFHWPFFLAIILAIIGVGVLGGLLELWLWRPLRNRGTGLIQMFIISIGLSLLIRHIILYFFGSSREQLAQATVQKPLHFGPIEIAPRDLILIIISIIVLIAVALMLQKTRMGKAMRALADNRDLAEASGIDVQRVTLQVWVLGGGLAAVGGVFFGLTTAVYWNMGWYLLLLMFAGVILGGLGSAYGAMLGSIVVGIVAQVSTVWFPADLQNAWAMLVLVVVLLVRPQGILGRLQRAG